MVDNLRNVTKLFDEPVSYKLGIKSNFAEKKQHTSTSIARNATYGNLGSDTKDTSASPVKTDESLKK